MNSDLETVKPTKILVSGWANHFFLLDLCRQLRENSSKPIELHVVTNSSNAGKINNSHPFDRIFFPKEKTSRLSQKIASLGKHISLVSRITERNFQQSGAACISDLDDDYDICAIHFARKFDLHFSQQLRKLARKLVYSLWGSDFYLLQNDDVPRYKQLVNASDVITIANPTTGQQLTERYGVPDSKIKICRMGLAPLDRMKANPISKASAREELGLSDNEFVITCGYNGKDSQRHRLIIHGLQEIQNELPGNVRLIIPMTYNAPRKYVRKIRNVCDASPFRYRILDDFLPVEEVALWRIASDVLIQIQPTDSFSGATQEHLFARNIVVTGSWLPYKPWEDIGIQFWTCDKPEAFGQALVKAIKDPQLSSLARNPELVFGFGSWQENIASWLEIYDL